MHLGWKHVVVCARPTLHIRTFTPALDSQHQPTIQASKQATTFAHVCVFQVLASTTWWMINWCYHALILHLIKCQTYRPVYNLGS